MRIETVSVERDDRNFVLICLTSLVWFPDDCEIYALMRYLTFTPIFHDESGNQTNMCLVSPKSVWYIQFSVFRILALCSG